MAVNDIILARFVCDYTPALQNTIVSFNLLHYLVVAEEGTGASIQAIAVGFSTAAATVYKPLLPVNASYRGCLATKIFPLPSGATSGSQAGNGPGTAVGEPMPATVAGVITKQTGLAGRRNRGRVFIPFPLEEDNQDDGTPNLPYIAKLDAWWIAMFQTFVFGPPGANSTLFPVIFHGPLSPPPVFQAITVGFSRNYWGTVRKRQNAFRNDALPIFIP